jgi:hypothetical protein
MKNRSFRECVERGFGKAVGWVRQGIDDRDVETFWEREGVCCSRRSQ